jgi:hypothetical protein
MTPLYGHTSIETAYVVNDYPYGRLRCQIIYWLEHDPKKGYRFCSRTTNPKNGRINAPKKSTYSPLAGAMYLDEQGHVTWTGLSHYSDAHHFREFVQRFPQAVGTTIQTWVAKKVAFYTDMASGAIRMGITVNGVKKVPTESELSAERERSTNDLAAWLAVSEITG